MSAMVTDQQTTAERVRLHITPFNRDLLDKLLPAPIQSQASNVSFHAVQTYPERGFGFLELPIMEAQKLKKKFNGTTLKGTKVRIEEAKPEKKRKPDQIEAEHEEKTHKKARKEKKKRVDGVVLGHELAEGRMVKRGWADDASLRKIKKDKQEESKKPLEHKKMQFKTSLPPNVAAAEAAANPKGKKRKLGTSKAAKVDLVVKEFSKASKPRLSKLPVPGAQAVMYEDGKGWLDADGNIVEAERPSQQRRRNQVLTSPVPELVDPHESSTESERESTLDNDKVDINLEHGNDQPSHKEPADSGSSSDSEDEDDSSSSTSSSSFASEDETSPRLQTDQSEQTSLSSTNGDVQFADREIHPLEALYKRPKPDDVSSASNQRPAPLDTSFNFFGTGNADDAEMGEEDQQIPQTPQTKKNLEWRSIRSAAPTPDTAVAGKRFSFALTDDEDEGEDEAEDPSYRVDASGDGNGQAAGFPEADEEEGQQREESEFRKWFYDNRGDLNRGWKKRRREDRKLQRQRENRRLSRRIA